MTEARKRLITWTAFAVGVLLLTTSLWELLHLAANQEATSRTNAASLRALVLIEAIGIVLAAVLALRMARSRVVGWVVVTIIIWFLSVLDIGYIAQTGTIPR